MDNHTSEQRSANMRAIRSKNTEIEMLLRQELYRRGLRYRLHYEKLPGKPDIVFLKKRIVIFIDSEFWHGYNWEETRHKIQSNREYWIPKIQRNIEHDSRVNEMLLKEGWLVLRFWGFEIKDDVGDVADQIEHALFPHR